MDICNQPRKLIGWLLAVGNRKYYNIKLNMRDFSRKVVVVLIVIFAQSSLGTNAALKDFSNVSTKSLSQNGYYKLPDGLMIQWGKKAGGSSYQGTITLPLSFHDDYYSLTCSALKGNLIDLSSWVVNYLNKTKSSFNYICTYAAEGNGTSNAEFHWIAIGRWK